MQVFSAILNLLTWQASLVRFQVSSIIKCYRGHENRSRSIVHKTVKIHLPTAEQYLHQKNIMLLELDLRMLLYFFQKIIGYVKIMFELLYIFVKSDPFSPHCAIMRFFR